MAADTLLPRRPRVALFGQFGMGNIGNDASLEAMILTLRQVAPDADLAVICSRPDIVSERFGLPAIGWLRPPLREGWVRQANEALFRLPYRMTGPVRAARIMRGFDMLLVPGTGMLDDFGERAGGVPYIVLKWVAAARLAGCRVAMASIGAGPIHGRVSRFFMMSAARLSNFLSFRDAPSRDFVIRHAGGTGLRSEIFPDLAFALPVPQAPAGPRADLALGVMRYRGWTNTDGGTFQVYIDRLATFAAAYLASGRSIRLVIGETADEEAVAVLRAAVAARSGDLLAARLLYEPVRDIAGVMRQMASAELAVATRFHNVVAALMVGTPVVSLSYGSKNDVLLADMGLGDFTAHVETFDPAWLAARVASLGAQRDRIAGDLRGRVTAYRAALARQGREIAGLLGATGAHAAEADAILSQEAHQ
ncbi:polysaccharide pyruvyl transferase family protein [Neoroseomonas oryzicola]|uniref:dTDP-4-dehydrorhamnose 3,5-epimerase n=1 Tax=Neoroseomonas oryzicola TaxID=535904 RepID=A0A9X9WHT2_9PROT|nr:dTDP-4-dehydrorhamnose 3,5-epimerase [Neoroseomonas oryzicola]NKE15668.1 dTDP-4-dehydrorhamnose 3,5-epimerase [Neoroseomonas oryzicola]